MMSMVDSPYVKELASTEQREKGLNEMIKLALESVIRI